MTTKRGLLHGGGGSRFGWDDRDDEDDRPGGPLEPDVSVGADGFDDGDEDNKPTDPEIPNPLTSSPTILISVEAVLGAADEPMADAEATRAELDGLVGADDTSRGFEGVADTSYIPLYEEEREWKDMPAPTVGSLVLEAENIQRAAQLRTQIAELEGRIAAEKAKKSWWGRLTSRFSGRTADEFELERLKAELMKLEEQPKPKSRVSSALKKAGLFAAVAALGIDMLSSVKNQTPEELSHSSAEAIKAPAPEPAPAESSLTIPEATTPEPAPQAISTETAPEQSGTLWNHLLDQNSGNEPKAAQAKKEYLQKNGARIVDSVNSDWLDDMEDDAQLWKDIIQPNLKKWGFSHLSLGMTADIESAQTLHDLLRAQRDNANWLEAEAVLMFQPDAWKNLKSGDSVETDDSADQTTPDIQEDLSDDLDLAPFMETPEPARPTQTPWYFDMNDGIISPSINDDEDDIVLPEPDDFDDIAPEDLQPIAFGPFDAPEPVAFIRARNKA